MLTHIIWKIKNSEFIRVVAISGCQRVSLMSQVCWENARNYGEEKAKLYYALLPQRDVSINLGMP